MRRRLKLLAWLVGVPFVLALGAAIVLPMLADSDYYKGRMTALFEAQTGHDLHIDGRVRLRVLPRPGVSVTDVRVASPPGFGTADLARLPWLAVDLQWLPLLTGRIAPNAIVASGLTLNLERDRDGRGNWEARTGTRSVERRRGGASMAAMTIGQFELRDATLHWRGQAGDEIITVPEINLKFGALTAGGDIDDVHLRVTLPGGEARVEARGNASIAARDQGLVMSDINATFRDLTVAGLGFDGSVDTQLAMDFGAERVSLEPLRLSARSKAGGTRAVAVEITTGLELDLARQRLERSTLLAALPAYTLSGIGGDLELRGTVSGDLGAGVFAFENVQATGTVGGEALAGSGAAFALAGTLNVDLQRRTVSAPALEITGNVDGDRLPFRLVADLDLSARTRTLDATGMQLSLRDWRVDGATSLRLATSPSGVQGVLDVRIQDQPLAGSFEVTRAQAHADAVDVRFDVVADLDIQDADFVLRGRNAVVLHAGIHPGPGSGSWKIADLQAGARLSDPASSRGDRVIRLQADLDVNTDDETVRTENLRVSLDESRIVGSASVRRFDDPTIRFDLEADSIDADRYLLPITARNGGSAGEMPIGASVDAIRALDVTGELRVRKLTLKGVRMDDVRLSASGGGGDG